MAEVTPFLVIMGFVFAGVLVFAYVVKMLEVRRARNWKVTTGRVIQSRTKANQRKDIDGKSIRETVPEIVYEYEVNGRRLRAGRISFAERITGEDLHAVLARYPAGATVQVSYNPLKPQEAVLEREMPASVAKGVSLLAIFFIAACLFIPFALGTAADWLAPRLADPGRAPFVSLSAGLGLFTLLFALAVQGEAWAARGWSETQGQVISSESEAYLSWSKAGGQDVLRTFFRPLIAYQYTVNGRSYVSDRVHFGGQAGWSSSRFFRRSLARYPVDAVVTVYYNPLNPSEAALERRSWGVWLLVAIGVLLLGLSAVAAYL